MRPPIFIIGSMRSGSTLLRLILDSHDNIAVPPETSFLRAAQLTQSIPNWKYGDGWYRRLDVSDGEMDQRLRLFYASIFQTYARRRGKQRWGDKSPAHVWQIRRAARLFPEAVFVALVRHPAAVATSMRDQFGRPFAESVDYWHNANAAILREGPRLGPERFVWIRYEDLVSDLDSVLRELVHWLGEPWSDQLLRFHEVQARRGNTEPTDGGTLPDEPVDADRAGLSGRNLTEQEWAWLRERALPLATFLGYRDLGNPMATEPLSADPHARSVTSASAMSRRMATAPPELFHELPAPAGTSAPVPPSPAAGARSLRSAARRAAARAVNHGRRVAARAR